MPGTETNPGGWGGGVNTHQIALVEQQKHVLVACILLQVLLQVPAARALRVPGIQHLHITSPVRYSQPLAVDVFQGQCMLARGVNVWRPRCKGAWR